MMLQLDGGDNIGYKQGTSLEAVQSLGECPRRVRTSAAAAVTNKQLLTCKRTL